MISRGNLVWSLVFTGDNLSLAEILKFSQKAEEAGAKSLWSTELGRDAFVPLAAISNVTNGISLGTGVATFARPPMHTETAAMTMAELTDNNFVLGLGTAPPLWNENWHGLKFERPVKRMREYIECIRKMWTATIDSPITFEGEMVKVIEYTRFIPAPYPSVPIYLAAVRENMVSLAGEVAEGIIGNLLNTPQYFENIVLPNLEAGLKKSGRDAKEFEIATLKVCAVNKKRSVARALAKHSIAFYSTLPYFDIVLDPAGFTEQKNIIRTMFSKNDFNGMLGAVSEDMVDKLALAGTQDEVLEQAKAFEGLIDNLILYCPTFGVTPEESRQNHVEMIEAFKNW
jgi:probable F420-dependent oxidoreductase